MCARHEKYLERGCQTGVTKGGGTHSAGFPNFLSDAKNQTKIKVTKLWKLEFLDPVFWVVGAQDISNERLYNYRALKNDK